MGYVLSLCQGEEQWTEQLMTGLQNWSSFKILCLKYCSCFTTDNQIKASAFLFKKKKKDSVSADSVSVMYKTISIV